MDGGGGCGSWPSGACGSCAPELPETPGAGAAAAAAREGTAPTTSGARPGPRFGGAQGGAHASSARPRRVVAAPQAVPKSLLEDCALNAALAVLPGNYEFEVHKTVWRLRQAGAKTVALQFPEGLQMYALTLADIFETFAGVEHCIVLGDVTYGACCIDDLSAQALGADFLVHYGHSCLVPVDHTTVPCMYVFVTIRFDVDHLVQSVRVNFPPGARIVMAGTIQFTGALHDAKARLAGEYPSLTVPQAKPLSPGEVLGCTAPTLARGEFDAVVFVADGRFHLEAIMIANPAIPAFRYDPYARVLTREEYDHGGMRKARRAATERAMGAKSWGIVMGTLGRQGNPAVVEHLVRLARDRGLPVTTVLMSELAPDRLAEFRGVEAWAQVACPRLSIDWGEGFTHAPVLTPFEATVALGGAPPFWEAHDTPYPMDYYAKDGAAWTSSYVKTRPRKPRPKQMQQEQAA